MVKAIPPQSAVVGHLYVFDVSQGGTTFVDPDGDPLTYTIKPFHLLSAIGPQVSARFDAPGEFSVGASVSDGREIGVDFAYLIDVAPNSSPVVASPNLAIVAPVGTHVNHDVTKGGQTFSEPDGDAMSYDVTWDPLESTCRHASLSIL